MALAGIMGGEGSEINDSTNTVLLESAQFDAPGVHRTSVAIGISSESSHRFERGVDIEGVEWASARAASLLAEHAGGAVCRGVVDVYPGKAEAHQIACRFARVRQLLGVEIEDAEILKILQSLDIGADDAGDGTFTVTVPSFRLDLSVEADVIEETARIHGLDNVPVAMPAAVLGEGVSDEPARKVSRCRDQLIALGLTEIMNYSYVSESLVSLFGGNPDECVVLPNPVSSEQSHLRSSLIPQVVESLGRNMSRQVDQAALFEIGRTFTPDEQGAIQEEDHLAIGLMGPVGRSGFEARDEVENEEMFLWIKGIVERLCDTQKIGNFEIVPVSHPGMQEGHAAIIQVPDKIFGLFGLVAESIRSEWRISSPVGVAEIDVPALIENALRSPSIESLPAYPSVSRDIAMIVPENVRHEDIQRTIREAGPAELTEIVLFDIFRSKRIGHGKKSMAYSLVYQSLERTLTDEEVNAHDRAVIDALQSRLDAEVREN